MALIRYPGSKEKLRRKIVSHFPDQMIYELWSNQKRWEYREPFFGAGAIGFEVLEILSPACCVWLNDIDPGMVALWLSVRADHEALIELLDAFEPTAEHFYQFKEEDGRTDLPEAQLGFRKLALHRTSFSGLGAKAGGPIGGKDQENAAYKVGCRWNPSSMKDEIWDLHERLRPFESFRFTCGDFTPLIEDAPRECFIYLDPPYYEKGPELYKYPMEHADHVRLSNLLRDTSATWVLSYDDHRAIRELYSWASIEEVRITYTCPTSKNGTRPKNHEIIITPANGI
jgi:DNA adenine methylase